MMEWFKPAIDCAGKIMDKGLDMFGLQHKQDTRPTCPKCGKGKAGY